MTTTRPRFSGSRTVAIAGATGMVGRRLVEALLARGVTAGGGFRPLHPTPGVVNWLVWRLFIRPILRRFPRVDPTPVDHELYDGQVLPVAGGLTVLHTPGHCAGQVCLLWPRHGGVRLAADAAANVFGLSLSVSYEDRAEGERQLRRLAALNFQGACFGHGKAIIGDAASQFRGRWPAGSTPEVEPATAPDRGGE